MMYQRPAMPQQLGTPNLAAKTALNQPGIQPAPMQQPGTAMPVNPTLGGSALPTSLNLPFDPNQGMQATMPQAMMPTAQLPLTSPMGLPGQSLATQRPSMAPLQQAQSAALRRF